MLCSICKEKEAKVFYTKIDGDKVHKIDVCEDCAKKTGVTDPTFGLADMLLGLGASKEIEQSSGGAEVKCPRCGFTQADFKKAGRLGCAECYKTFAEGLESLLKTMHKGTRHVGKVPVALKESREQADRLQMLQTKLAKAIDAEDFEQAAKLRDEIKQVTPRAGGVGVA